jgi:hypothetical protein
MRRVCIDAQKNKKKGKGKKKKMTDSYATHCPARFMQSIGQQPDSDGFIPNSIIGTVKEMTVGPPGAEEKLFPTFDACLYECKVNSQGCVGVSVAEDKVGGSHACRLYFEGHGAEYDLHYKPRWKSKFLKTSTCESLCSPRLGTEPPKWCNDALTPACSLNANNGFCRNFCALRGENCDSIMFSWCQDPAHPERQTDDLCACFRPTSFYTTFFNDLVKQIKLPVGNTQPECNYPPCSASPIKTSAAKQGTCPNIQNCLIFTEIKNDGTIVGDIKIDPSLSCSMDYAGGGDNEPASQPFYKQTWGIVLLVVLALVILALIGYGVSGLTKTTTSKSGSKSSSGGSPKQGRG